MNRNKQIRVLSIRNLRPVLQGDERVLIASQNSFCTEFRLKKRLQAFREIESQLLFHETGGTDIPGIRSSMTGVDDNARESSGKDLAGRFVVHARFGEIHH